MTSPVPRTGRAPAYRYCDTPIGRLLLAGDEDGLHAIRFPTEGERSRPQSHWRRDDSAFEEAVRQLAAYFAGDLTRFDLPLHMAGTEFRNRVWSELRAIPYGETLSYAALAKRIGRPKAFRAVGAANGANPLPIVVPCHRVIGSDGSLTGFGGGVEVKRFLLELEGVVLEDR